VVTAPLEPACLVSPVPRNTCSIRLRVQPLDGLLHWCRPRLMPGAAQVGLVAEARAVHELLSQPREPNRQNCLRPTRAEHTWASSALLHLVAALPVIDLRGRAGACVRLPST
jgi:hypothetical protein